MAGVFVPDLQEYETLYKEYTKAERRIGGKYKEGKFICHICGAVMVRSAQYYHLRTIHKIGATEYTCEVCNKVDLCKYKHLNHLKTHSNERPFVCPHCGKSFKNKSSLALCERRCTGLGVYECSTCSRTFTVKQRLKYHEMMHKGIRPHECPLCHLTYTRRSNMVDHVKRVHKKRLADVVAEAINESTEQNGLPAK